VRIQALKEWAPLEAEFYKQRYLSASKGNYDLYQVMVERGLELLSAKGLLGVILPYKFFNSKAGEPLRELLTTGKHVSHIVFFSEQQVFVGATTYTCLMFLSKDKSDFCEFEKVTDLSSCRIKLQNADIVKIPASNLTATEWNFRSGAPQIFL